jgi:ABC-type Fe3+ transport system permease subunit
MNPFPLFVGVLLILIGLALVIFRVRATQINEDLQRRRGGQEQVDRLRRGLKPGITAAVGVWMILMGIVAIVVVLSGH